MELRQLKYFTTTTQLKQITKAAQELNLSQPALSAQIKLLEDELGVKLFDRTKRQVILTEAGKLLYKYANTIFQQVHNFNQELSDLKNSNQGNVVIGALPSIIVSWLPHVIYTFNEKYPGISIQVKDMQAPEIVKSMENYELELGLFTELIDKAEFQSYPLLEEELMLIAPMNHRLAQRTSIDMIELVDEQFILTERDHQTRYTIINACLEAGFSPKVAFENNRVQVIINCVSSGLGVSFAPRVAFDFIKHHSISVIPVKNPTPIRKICVTQLKKRYVSESVKIFIEHLFSYFQIDSPLGT